MLTIAAVDGLNGDAQKRFTRILVDSFPAEERDDPDQVLANIEEGRRRSMAAYDGQDLVGFAVLLDLQGADAVLLEYLAVAEEVRSRGVGGQLLDRVIDALTAGPSPPAGLILEVEPPDTADGEEAVLRRRRVAFYERHGAVVVMGAPAYRVPSTTGPDVLPFLLMWRPVAGAGPVEGEGLHRVVRALLIEGYEFGDDDPFVRSVLADLVG